MIANIAANSDVWDTTYKSLIPESIGNFGFNLGGMLELPITLSQDPETKVALAAAQAGLMLVYGAFHGYRRGHLRMGSGPTSLDKSAGFYLGAHASCA